MALRYSSLPGIRQYAAYCIGTLAVVRYIVQYCYSIRFDIHCAQCWADIQVFVSDMLQNIRQSCILPDIWQLSLISSQIIGSFIRYPPGYQI